MNLQTNILTFDIEDWFHLLDLPQTRTEAQWESFPTRIIDNTKRILDLLAESNIRATFFCLGWVGKKYPHLLREIHNRGFEIGSHTNNHQLIYEQTEESFYKDVADSLDILQNITGNKIVSFRAPGFSLTRECVWAVDALIENGIQIDSSIFPAHRSHGGFADFGSIEPAIIRTKKGCIKEFPINIGKLLNKNVVFSGGGYFRLFPYPIIYNLMKQSPYVMTYFHPRDFDWEQPIIPGLSVGRKFKAYFGLKGAFKKLKKLLANFTFIDLATANMQYKWENSKTISL